MNDNVDCRFALNRKARPILRCMEPDAADAVVWIGVVGIVPRDGCELLSPDEGAYTNFLTLAKSDSEYRAKVIGALSYYRLELLEFEHVRPFSASDGPKPRQKVRYPDAPRRRQIAKN